MSTPSIPGVDRDALAEAILRTAWIGIWSSNRAADAALAHIAAHHECPVLPSGTSPHVLRLAADDIGRLHLGFGGLPRSLPGTLRELADALEAAEATPPTADEPTATACDREHTDEWVEVDMDTWLALPDGTRMRREWVRGGNGGGRSRQFIHRDDMPDDPRTLIARHLGTEQANTFLSWLDKNGWTVTRKGER